MPLILSHASLLKAASVSDTAVTAHTQKVSKRYRDGSEAKEITCILDHKRKTKLYSECALRPYVAAHDLLSQYAQTPYMSFAQ